MIPSKITSMADAIARVVPSGASVCMGTALEAAIPFAAGHEIIRQRLQNLTLIGPISDMLFDQLIGAGCVARFIGAWVGNVSSGLGHNYRRAFEQGIPRPIAVEDQSNFTIALSLLAATLGAPYIPTRALLGTGFLDSNPAFKRAEDPYSGDPIVLVPALVPDVTILQVQRADAYGRCHLWGTVGISREAAFAARRVIVVAEEIWPTERIVADPNLILVPDVKVAAVVHEPFGALPAPLQGFYGRYTEFFTRYHEASRTPEGFARWLDEWVLGVVDWKGFLDKLGTDALKALVPRRVLLSEPLDYGA
ncbi:MAG: CoA transferase subunit A [Candidatus Rokubacteria bacterium]|nr:CoA transferase subunit A [Candidatus Rokubacteria bacterium]